MVEKIVIIPEEVRGLGDIVSSKSASDFMMYNGKLSSSTDADYGTVFSESYLAGSKIILSGFNPIISPDSSSVSVTGYLKDNSNNVITGATVRYRVNDIGVATVTDNTGKFTFTVNIGEPSGQVIAPSTSYEVRIWYEGSSTVGGCFLNTKAYAIDPDSLCLVSDKEIIQTGDYAELVARLTGTNYNGETVGIPGQTVYFYEEWIPGVRVSADKSIIQSGDTVDFSAQLVDLDDGSLVRASGETVDFFTDNPVLTDALTSDTGLVSLTGTGGSISYSSNGMKFKQDSGSTYGAYAVLKDTPLDVLNQNYEIQFDVTDFTTADNTPLRCRLLKGNGDVMGFLANVNTSNSAGWRFFSDDWDSTYHSFSNTGHTIKIHLENEAHKLYCDGTLVASSDRVIEDVGYIAFADTVGYYVQIKNLTIKEV